MSQATIQDRSAQHLPLDAQVKYLSLQAELELLMQQVRSEQEKAQQKS